MIFGVDLQGIRQDRRAAVRRGSEAYDLRTERNSAIVTIVRLVRERDANGHS